MSIPGNLEAVISAFAGTESEFWALVSAHCFAEEVAQNPDHLLVFVKTHVDFTRFEQACAGYHLYVGERGQEATHTIGQLCRALVAKTVNNWSYRDAEGEIRSNSLVRGFVGYHLKAQTLDHMTLWRFERWVKTHQPRRCFDEVLHQIDAAFPEEAKREQIGDTFGMASRAKAQSRTELLRSAAQKMLDALAPVHPQGYGEIVVAYDAVGLFGAADERPERFLEKPARDAVECRTAGAAYDCLQLVQGLLAGLPESREVTIEVLRHWTGVLAKILGDEFTITTDETGKVAKVTHLTKPPKGLYRMGSTVDVEATFRNHGKSSTLGYNINVAATVNFVREINAVTGATPDGNGVARLIAIQHEQLGLMPPKLIYDRAAGTPKIYAQVSQASGGQTQLVARMIQHNQKAGRFGPLDFIIDAGLKLTCPNGQVAEKRTYSGSAQGWNFRFTAKQCAGCPLMAKCRGDAVKPGARRQVFISDYRYFQQQALDYTKTAAFDLDMKTRSNIERIIAGVTRYNGGRRAKGDGVANADYQAKMAAVAYNLKRWHKIVLERAQAQRYQPPPSMV